jgi:hypothetical protein
MRTALGDGAAERGYVLMYKHYLAGRAPVLSSAHYLWGQS